MIEELPSVSRVSGVKEKFPFVGDKKPTEGLQFRLEASFLKGRRATQQEVKTLVYGTKQEAFARQNLKIPGFQHGHTNSCQFIVQLRLKVNSGAGTRMKLGAKW